MGLRDPFLLPWTLAPGDFAPLWSAFTVEGTAHSPELLAGRALLLLFIANEPGAPAFLDALAPHLAALEQSGCLVRAFSRSRELGSPLRAVPVLLDEDQKIARAYCLPLAERSHGEPGSRAVLIDRGARVLMTCSLELSAKGAANAVGLARANAPYSVLRPSNAPVLLVPRLFSPEYCEELIGWYRKGPTVEGTVVRLRDGKPEHIVRPEHKRRRDHRIFPPQRDGLWEQIRFRLLPAVRRAFRFDITRFEYLQVGRYAADEGGHFNAHRDDDHAGNAHRRFALTVNLNEEYEGGELVFHESETQVRPERGGAVMFSCSLLHEAKVVTQGERFVLVGMFWGDAEVAQAERNLAAPAKPAPAATAAPASLPPPALRSKQLIESGRMLREVAAEVDAFGAHLDTPAADKAGVAHRILGIHRELTRLRTELASLRQPFLDEQVQKLALPAEPQDLKLHLGCGGHLLPGWVNIDVSGGNIRMDLRWRLPFPDASVQYIFASHVVEHLFRGSELPAVLREIRRVLKPGGVMRAVVPDVEKCLRAYVNDDAQFFEDRKKTWGWAANCKTPLEHFLTYAGANQALEGYSGHKYGYDLPTLRLVLEEAGFSRIEKSEFMQSDHPPLRIDNKSSNAQAVSNGVYYSLFVEATK